MAQIKVNDVTFSYEGSFDDVLTNVNFSIDTDWKLGLIGRNGKGKTTLLKLLMGKYECNKGSISSSTRFDYFPYEISEDDLDKTADELAYKWKSEAESWQIMIQLNQIGLDAECLYRPLKTLSFGERTRVMLAVLFAVEGEFLLIDEPTNHLDTAAREAVKKYLSKKKGFILVSHDRDLLDAVCDHVLVLNRNTIEVQAGNFSTWWENKEKADAFAKSENEKHIKEINKLKASAERAERWADKNEATKIGFDPVKEHDRFMDTRAYIGAKTKKMQSRVKNFEGRIDREIDEKEGLLKDIEREINLKVMPLKHHKDVLVLAKDLTLRYEDAEKPLFENLRFEIRQGERVVLKGENGCGKSSIIKAILGKAAYEENISGYENLIVNGTLDVASGLKISYINQDTSFLTGSLKDYCKAHDFDESLFLGMLNRLDFNAVQFSKNMEDFSEGQKKKVLIASSLITPAHLYIWDEPLNYIDVFSRMQIEKLILSFKPTMLIVEHDVRFQEKVATEIIICKTANLC